MRRLIVFAGCAAAVVVSGAAGAMAVGRGEWIWHEGSPSVSIGEPAGSNDLVLNAEGSLNVLAGHVRLMSNSGRFTLVHGPSTNSSSIVAYDIGTPNRTPIVINGPLVVAGSKGGKSDLQDWTSSGQTVAAIDSQGHLRLGNITIFPVLKDGYVVLYARLPDGSIQALSRARR